MVPSNASANGGDPQGFQWRHGQKDGGGPNVLQAAKVAIHVKPRSPGRSPARFLSINASGAAHTDVSALRDVGARPLLHLEVQQQQLARGGDLQPALSKPVPRAIIDVVHFNARGVAQRGPAATGPAAAASAGAVATGASAAAPPGAAVRPGSSRATPAGGATTVATAPAGRFGAQPRPVPAGRQPGGLTAAAVPGSGSTSKAPYSRSGGSGGGSAQLLTAAAASHSFVTAAVPAAGTAAAAAAAAATPAAPGGAVVAAVHAPAAHAAGDVLPGSSHASAMHHPGLPVLDGPSKRGGAALLAELLGTHIGPAGRLQQTDTQQGPQAAAPGLPSLGQASFSFGPQARTAAAPDATAAFLRDSVGLAWSREDLWAGVPDPDEEARRARRRHRKRVARIVVDHWKAFAAEGLRAVAARRHLRRRLLTAAWVAWQSETAAARSRLRLAAVYDMKRSYLGLGRCVQAWSAAAKRLARLRSLEERVALSRLLRQSHACLRAWRVRCYYSAEMRRRQLQAWFYYCFSTLTRALRKWHVWAASRRAKVRRAAWASEQHTAALGRKALAAWCRCLAHRLWKAAALREASAFRRTGALRGALRGWRDAVATARAAREVAEEALRVAAAGLQAQTAADAFMEWRAQATERRRRRQRERYGLAYMRRWWQLVAMWAWRQLVARKRHLRMCERELQRVGRRVRLGLVWSRWWLAVEVLQGQRNAELRAAVLGRACWAAWRAAVEHGAAKRELLRVATQRVGRVVAAAALAAWRARAEHWRAKADARALAAAWHRRRALAALLRAWRHEAGRLIAKAAAGRTAAQHWRRVVLRRVVRLWRRYAWRRVMKLVAADHYPTRLLRSALRGWLGHSRYKARKELDRRTAVRHRYLTLLRSGLLAFRASVERRLAKQRDWADLARLHALRVCRDVLRVWRRDFVPLAAAKRAVARRADMQRRTTLARSALAGWVQEAARLAAKHARQREAAGFASLRLLRRALCRWAVAPALQEARRAAKAARLAAMTAALAVAATRRLLAAWRDVHEDLVMKRFQDSRARAAWRHRTLRRALASWALHLAHRRAAALLHARAVAARRLRIWRGVMAALAAHAGGSRAKRRVAAVACEHRRVGLLRRALAALAWYGRYRVAKARGYAAARALYVRRLQREGVAAWLQVGLERRQQRIEMLAAQQAHRLVQQLARVEPFARRWLQVVRSRRRQAYGLDMSAATSAFDFATGPVSRHQPSSWPAAGALGAGRRAAAAQRTTAVPAAAAVTAATAAVAAARGRRDGLDYLRERPDGGESRADEDFPGFASYGLFQLAWQSRGLQEPGLETVQPVGWRPAAVGGPAASRVPGWAARGEPPSEGAAVAGVAHRRPPPRTPPAVQGVSWPTEASPGAPGTSTYRVGAATAGAADAAFAGSIIAAPGGGGGAFATGLSAAWPPHGAAHRTAAEGWQQPAALHLLAVPDSLQASGGAPQRAPLRGLNAAAPQPGGVASRPGSGAGGAKGPIGPGRARPQPRCPYFLLSRRPATVSGVPEAAGVRMPHGRPALSAVPGGGEGQAAGSPGTATAAAAITASGSGGGRAATAGGGGVPAAPWQPLRGQPVQPPPLFFANLPQVRTQSPGPLGPGAALSAGGPGVFDLGAAVRSKATPAAAAGGGDGSRAVPRVTGVDRPAGESTGLGAVAGATTAAFASPSPTAGIIIHCAGPQPPDVLRLPSRGGGANEDGTTADGSRHGSRDIGGAAAAAGPFNPAGSGSPIPGKQQHVRLTYSAADSTLGQDGNDAHRGQWQGGLYRDHAPTEQPELPAALRPQRPEPPAPHQPPPHPYQPCPEPPATHPQQSERSAVQQYQPHHQPHPPCLDPPAVAATAAVAILADGELAELESVLLHCKSLKHLLQQLQQTQQEDGMAADQAAAGVVPAPAAGVGKMQLQQQQAEEVRAALVALRPTVEYAAARLRQIRGLAG